MPDEKLNMISLPVDQSVGNLDVHERERAEHGPRARPRNDAAPEPWEALEESVVARGEDRRSREESRGGDESTR